MKIITLLNEKGGVGKTSVATHIAAWLAIQGQRVLVIDSDPQANMTDLLQVDHGPGLMELLVDDAEWRNLLRVAPKNAWCGQAYPDKGEMLILPGNIKTRAIPMLVDDVWRLRERLDELRDVVDVVVIDTPPSPSMLHVQVYLATDSVIYPTEFEMLALTGLKRSVEHMENLNKQREMAGLKAVKLMGIQPTKAEPNTLAHDYGAGLTLKKFKNRTWPALPKRTKWRDAAFALQTLFAYCPEDVATQEVEALGNRVLRGLA